jgi:hypothetical protein
MSVISDRHIYMDSLHRDIVVDIVARLHHRDIGTLSLVSKQLNAVCNSNDVWHGKLLRRTHRHYTDVDPRRLFYRSLQAGVPRVISNNGPFQLSTRRDVVRVASDGQSVVIVTVDGECALYRGCNELVIGPAEDALVQEDGEDVVVATLYLGNMEIVRIDKHMAITQRCSVPAVQGVVQLVCLTDSGTINGHGVYGITHDKRVAAVLFHSHGHEPVYYTSGRGVVSCYASYVNGEYQLHAVKEDGSIYNRNRPSLYGSTLRKYMRVGDEDVVLLEDDET